MAILFVCLAINVYSQHENIFAENKLFTYQTELNIEVPVRETIMLPYKGKKMIIDFFSSSCVVCFRMMPKMDSIQERHKNDLRVLLIGKEDQNIRSIYQRFSRRFKIKLPVAFDSTIFSQFNIEVVPIYAWIDENGIVKAITGSDEMTDENISLFINNKNIVRAQNEKLQKFDPDRLLFVNGNGGNEENMRYRSLLAEWTQSLPFYIPPSLKTTSGPDKFQALGVTVSNLYSYAYFGIPNWDVQHPYYGKIFPTPLIKNKNGDMFTPLGFDKRFCYSLYKSNAILSDFFISNHLRKDLEFYFGYQARLVDCNVPCWKLSVTNKKCLPVSIHIKAEIKSDAAGFTVLNQPISKLLQIIYRYNPLDVPIIDCTGINYNIALNVEASMEDMRDIAKSLEPFGLKLIRSEVQMKAIILEEIK